jgi:uncharacterized protein
LVDLLRLSNYKVGDLDLTLAKLYSETKSNEMNNSLVKNINLPMALIREFCHRWQIVEFALFGSVLRDDFNANSDIDILVTFAPESRTSLVDFVTMEWELEDMLDRKVDLLTRQSVIDSPNWIRRKEILCTARVIYETRFSLSA